LSRAPYAYRQREQRHPGQRQYEQQHHAAERRQRVVFRGLEDQVSGVGGVVEQEQGPFPAGDQVAGEEDRQAGHRHCDHHRDVEGERRAATAMPSERATS
jgi:hypothetical protein